MNVSYFTMFDIRYAARGLVLVESLMPYLRSGDDVTVLALDGEAARVVSAIVGSRCRVLQLDDLNDIELMEVRKTRAYREFCWTVTPAMSRFMVRSAPCGRIVVYVDADMMFFKDPQLVLRELGEDRSILIHEHRYSPDRMAWLATSGRFNVGLVAFRVCEESGDCVELWRRQTIDECVLDPERGACGDQAYLNEWPDRYPRLRVMENIGGGTAPWNVNQYQVTSGPMVNSTPIIFYHYHALKLAKSPRFGIVAAQPAFGYEFSDATKRYVYKPYARKLRSMTQRLAALRSVTEPDKWIGRHELRQGLDNGTYVAATPLARLIAATARIRRPRSLIAALKAVAKLLLPGGIVVAARWLRARTKAKIVGPASGAETTRDASPPQPPAEWEAMPNTPELWTETDGWAHQSIADVQRAKWPAFVESIASPRPLGLSHEAPPDAPIDVNVQNMVLTFTHVLGLVAGATGRLSILDWGGGVGHYAAYAHTMRPDLDVDYTICDLPPLMAAGRDLCHLAQFVDRPEALRARYDLVFASSSIQYERNLYDLIRELCAASKQYLFVTRSPFVEEHDDFVVVQRPYMHGYQTEYAAWFINRHRFISFVEENGFRLEREFLLAERPFVPNAPEQCRYCGFLFKRYQ